MFQNEHKDEEAYAEVMNLMRHMNPTYTEMIREVYKVLSKYKKHWINWI